MQNEFCHLYDCIKKKHGGQYLKLNKSYIIFAVQRKSDYLYVMKNICIPSAEILLPYGDIVVEWIYICYII